MYFIIPALSTIGLKIKKKKLHKKIAAQHQATKEDHICKVYC